jgi:hypothetical protein
MEIELVTLTGNELARQADRDRLQEASCNKEVDDLESAPGLSEPEAGVVHQRRQFSVERDENGDQYFVDNLTQETMWDLPENGEVVAI